MTFDLIKLLNHIKSCPDLSLLESQQMIIRSHLILQEGSDVILTVGVIWIIGCAKPAILQRLELMVHL